MNTRNLSPAPSCTFYISSPLSTSCPLYYAYYSVPLFVYSASNWWWKWEGSQCSCSGKAEYQN